MEISRPYFEGNLRKEKKKQENGRDSRGFRKGKEEIVKEREMRRHLVSPCRFLLVPNTLIVHNTISIFVNMQLVEIYKDLLWKKWEQTIDIRSLHSV